MKTSPTTKSLAKRQEELINKLKQEHPEIYSWFQEKKIDLHKLGKYTSNIASALALVVSTSQPPTQSAIPQLKQEASEVRVIERQELRGKSESERALLVWQRYGEHIRKTSAKYNIDPQLIFATIMIESGGDTYAVRQEPRINDASYGLGQILFRTARGIGFTGAPSELFDPEINIDLIGRYHRRNLDANPDLSPQQLTIAYNTGSPYKKPYPGHIAKFNKWYNHVTNLPIDLS